MKKLVLVIWAVLCLSNVAHAEEYTTDGIVRNLSTGEQWTFAGYFDIDRERALTNADRHLSRLLDSDYAFLCSRPNDLIYVEVNTYIANSGTDPIKSISRVTECPEERTCRGGSYYNRQNGWASLGECWEKIHEAGLTTTHGCFTTSEGCVQSTEDL